MNKKQLDEKHQKILRKLLTLPENKKCFDCSEKGPFYACTTLGTFVCTTCSGIHREFQHHVKSISMASFKPEEVQFLEEMGNGRAKEIWLAYWTPSDYPEPESTDRARVREFMKLKYERKKWFARPGAARGNNNGARSEKQSRSKKRDEEPPRVEPIESILGRDIPPISITHNINLPLGNNGSAPRREEPRVVQPTKSKDPFLVSWGEEPIHPVPAAHTRSPQLPPQQFPPPATGGHAPPSGGISGLESVFTHPEPTKNPMGSTVWPPPAGGVAPAPHMGGGPVSGVPGMMPAGGMGAFPQGGAVPFQQVSPQVFQQMAPQQQQQYLVMQQQWIQQQQFLLQQRMAGMTLGGAPPAGAGMMMPPHIGPGAGAPGMVAAYPGAPVMHPGMGGSMPPAAAMGHNPFLAGPASGPTSGGVLAPAPYGSSGPGGAPAAHAKQNDALFADLSPLSASKPAGSSSAPAPSAPVSRGPGIGMAASSPSPSHSPFFPTATGPTPLSPALSPAMAPNPFASSAPAYSSGGFPSPPAAGSNGTNAGFNPFGSLI